MAKDKIPSVQIPEHALHKPEGGIPANIKGSADHEKNPAKQPSPTKGGVWARRYEKMHKRAPMQDRDGKYKVGGGAAVTRPGQSAWRTRGMSD